MDIQHFPQQVVDVIGFLSGTLPREHPYANIQSQPGPPPESIPGIWLLGSSDYSAQLAAILGLPFSFAEFFGTAAEHGPTIAELYRQRFRPSGYLQEPKLNVAVQVVCAASKDKADFIASSRNISRINSLRGIYGPFLPPEEAARIDLSGVERTHLTHVSKHAIQGDPVEVKEKIFEAGIRYGTTDISIVTNCYHFEDRVKSYELISEAFNCSTQ